MDQHLLHIQCEASEQPYGLFMDISINSDAWQNAGAIVARSGKQFVTGVRGELSALTNTGTDGKRGSIDALVAGILPAVMEAVNPTIDGIARGLTDEADGLIETGLKYAEVEDEANNPGQFEEGEQ